MPRVRISERDIIAESTLSDKPPQREGRRRALPRCPLGIRDKRTLSTKQKG